MNLNLNDIYRFENHKFLIYLNKKYFMFNNKDLYNKVNWFNKLFFENLKK